MPSKLLDSLHDELLSTCILRLLEQPADWANFCLASKRCRQLALAAPKGALQVRLWDPAGPPDEAKNQSFTAFCKAWLARQRALGLVAGLPVHSLNGPTPQTLTETASALGGLQHLEIYAYAYEAEVMSATLLSLESLNSLSWGGAGTRGLHIAGHPGLQRLILYCVADCSTEEDLNLSRLPSLKDLVIDRTGPMQLSGWSPSLSTIRLSSCPSLQLSPSCSLPRLEYLSVYESVGWVTLGAACPAMRSVYAASGTLVLDEGSSFPDLSFLHTLGHVEGLATCHFPALEYLILENPSATPDGRYPPLAALKSLKNCWLRQPCLTVGEVCSLPALEDLSCHCLTLGPGCNLPALRRVTCQIDLTLRPGCTLLAVQSLSCNKSLILGEGCSLPALGTLGCSSCSLKVGEGCSLPALETLNTSTLTLGERCILPALHTIYCRKLAVGAGCTLPMLDGLYCDSLILGNKCTLPALRNLLCVSMILRAQCSLPALKTIGSDSITMLDGCSLPALERLDSHSVTLGQGCSLPSLELLEPHESLVLGQGCSLPTLRHLVCPGTFMEGCSLPHLQSLTCHGDLCLGKGCSLPQLRSLTCHERLSLRCSLQALSFLKCNSDVSIVQSNLPALTLLSCQGQLTLEEGCSLPSITFLSCQGLTIGGGCSMPALKLLTCHGHLDLGEGCSLPALESLTCQGGTITLRGFHTSLRRIWLSHVKSGKLDAKLPALCGLHLTSCSLIVAGLGAPLAALELIGDCRVDRVEAQLA